MKLFFTTLVIALGMSSCAPVNYFTQLRTLPREYSENYQIEGIKAPKSDIHKTPWIVWSDRSENMSYLNPGGRVTKAQLNFGDPLLVLRLKGEYLELIRYKAENIKNNRLSARKKAEYVGWVHRSRLILSPSSITDVRSGLSDKLMVVLKDSSTVLHPEKYLINADSVKVYDSPELDKPTRSAALGSIVYILKTANNGSAVLLSQTPDIQNQKTKEQLTGWMPVNVLQAIGRRVFVKTSLANDVPQPKALGYSPFIRPQLKDSTYSFISGVFTPIIDKSDNLIFNIDGDAISYSRSVEMANELQQINILFVMEPSSTMTGYYPLLLNVIQNFQTRFADKGSAFNYRFAASIAINGTVNAISPHSDYTAFLDSLVLLTPRMKSQNTSAISPWATLRSGLELFRDTPSATNLAIVIGEKADDVEVAPDTIVNRLNELNFRILGLQLHSQQDDAHNNFVLQLTDMIERYAQYQNTAKRKRIVYMDQYCRGNLFREVQENFYMLDYPDASMVQGGVMFPIKDQPFEIELFPMAMDSILTRMQSDNLLLSVSLKRAFATVGNTKDKYANKVRQELAIPSDTKLSHEFKQMFEGKAPMCYLPSGRVTLADSTIQYRLMLMKSESDELRANLEALCKMEVDIKDVAKPSKKKMKDLCRYIEELENLTDEELNSMKDKVINRVDTVYASTKKPRRHLYKFYLSKNKNCRVCQTSNRYLKRMTLATAHKEIFGVSSNSPILDSIRIKDLKKPGKVSDAKLDGLINYFKDCKANFEKKHTEEQFTSAEQTYYYIDSKLLP